MVEWMKGRVLLWVTAVTVAYCGMANLYANTEVELLPFPILVTSVFAPCAILVVMVRRPQRFRVQFREWFMGTAASALLAAVVTLLVFLLDGSAFFESFFGAMFIGSLAMTSATVVYSLPLFLLGVIINFFQKKPDSPQEYQKIFE